MQLEFLLFQASHCISIPNIASLNTSYHNKMNLNLKFMIKSKSLPNSFAYSNTFSDSFSFR
jgi:hypothetical protein